MHSDGATVERSTVLMLGVCYVDFVVLNFNTLLYMVGLVDIFNKSYTVLIQENLEIDNDNLSEKKIYLGLCFITTVLLKTKFRTPILCRRRLCTRLKNVAGL